MDTNGWPITINKRSASRSGNVLALSPSLLKQFGFEHGEQVVVRLGRSVIEAKVVSGKKGRSLKENVLLLGSTDQQFQGLYGCKLKLSIEDRQVVHIGPIIGVFTYHEDKVGGKTKPFAAQTDTFKNLVRIGKKNRALVYIFKPNELQVEEKYIMGKTLKDTKGDQWTKRLYPWPDVVYDRIPTRKDEGRSEVQVAKQALLNSPGIKYFNPKFLDKWHVYKMLVRSYQAQEYLPKTTLLTDVSTVLKYLKKYSIVYLKPTASSIGRGIIQIKWENNQVKYSYKERSGKNIEKFVSSQKQLKKLLKGQIGAKNYLVQQGIRLAQYDKRPFDVRLLAQKDLDGAWQVTGMAARVAGEGSITTHIPNGGTSQPLAKALKHAFAGSSVKVAEVISNLFKMAKILPEVFEANTGQLYGELSMDVGVDISGRVWLIELNSKPFRFDEKNIRKKSWENTIKYASLLAGF